MEVNAYNGITNAQAAAKSNQRQLDNKSGLDINDFMTLLATQLSNQDIMNPQSDTEFIAQMAQFTSLRAMQSIADMAQTQYAASIVGKKVIVADIDKSNELQTDTGYVERVKFADGESIITVNGKDYRLSSVMEVVSDIEEPKTPDEGDKETPDVPKTPSTDE